jgi:choice-of-anchor C domain-containing protein
MKMYFLVSLITAVLLSTEALRAQIVIINGSFESNGIPVGTIVTVNSGDTTSLPGWTVADSSINIYGSLWTHIDGSKSIDLSGDGLGTNPGGTIKQTLSGLTPQDTYRLNFLLAGNPEIGSSGTTLKSCTVSFGSQSNTVSFNTSGKTTGNLGWVTTNCTFRSSSNIVELKFHSNNTGNSGPAVDRVVLRHGS